MAKQFYSCNWAPSQVTEEQLNGMVKIGTSPKKNEIRWRVPGLENPPTPKQGEVVVFVDHIGRGFKPLGSNFSGMCLPAFNSTLRTLAQTLCPMSAISKYFARLIFKRSPQLNCLGISSI